MIQVSDTPAYSLLSPLSSRGVFDRGSTNQSSPPLFPGMIWNIGDNLNFLKSTQQDLFGLLDCFQRLLEAAKQDGRFQKLGADIKAKADEIDLAFLREELPQAVEQSISGVQQVSHIVMAMKEFFHPGTKEKTLVDLNHALENTLTISHNGWKHVAQVETDFETNLPLDPCLAGEINQVFLNLVVNATQTIASQADGNRQGMIRNQPLWTGTM